MQRLLRKKKNNKEKHDLQKKINSKKKLKCQFAMLDQDSIDVIYTK